MVVAKTRIYEKGMPQASTTTYSHKIISHLKDLMKKHNKKKKSKPREFNLGASHPMFKEKNRNRAFYSLLHLFSFNINSRFNPCKSFAGTWSVGFWERKIEETWPEKTVNPEFNINLSASCLEKMKAQREI